MICHASQIPVLSVHSKHANLGRRAFVEARRRFNESSGPEDNKAGFALLKKAATLGCVKAHEWLGYVYDYGYGTRPNRRLAFRHYMTAAEPAMQTLSTTSEFFTTKGFPFAKTIALLSRGFGAPLSMGTQLPFMRLAKLIDTDGVCGRTLKRGLSWSWQRQKGESAKPSSL